MPFKLISRVAAFVLLLGGLVWAGSPAHARVAADGDPPPPTKAAAAGVIATLSGEVSTPDGGVVDGSVSVFQWDGESFFEAGSTDVYSEDGPAPYSFDLETGTYYVQVTTYSGDYLTAFSDGATEPPVTAGDPGAFELTADGATQDFVLTPAPARQPVTGTVTDADGNPVSEIYIYADGPSYDEAYTDETGAFTLSLRPGTYALYVDGGEEFTGTSVDVDVDADGVELDPIALTPAGHFAVDGKVLDHDGTPLAGATAQLVRLYGNPDDGFQDWDYVDEATTDAEGHYAFDHVRVDRFYSVRATGEDNATLFAGNVASVSDPGLEYVALSGDHTFGDITLPRSKHATGTLTGSGTPLADGRVQVYQWEDYGDGAGEWSQADDATTQADGTYKVKVPDDATITLRFSRGGFLPEFLGGGTQLPDAPTAENSRTTGGVESLDIGTIDLAPFVSKLGKVAGQKLDYCKANALPANDDDSTDAVALPFDLKFYGNSYDQLYVNNNGNVTFSEPLGDFTPEDITGETGRPIIAPFFADVDTTGESSNVVTYGASPDGKTFCVNWADVGYFAGHDDKLNTFQLLLTTNQNSPGRVAGDFDIRFNYDEVLWETGDASDGDNGFGGTSALAGFSAGTGQPGSFVQLPGSLDNGALIDGGPDSLVAGSQNSPTQLGRYNFEVRNNGFASSLGGLKGTVVNDHDPQGPVVGASVSACNAVWTCYYGETNGAGGYSFTGVQAGSYTIEVDPPAGLFAGGASATVVAGETATVDPIVLSAPEPMPGNVTMSNNGVDEDGVPSVYYGDPIDFAVNGCAGKVNPTYTVTLADGHVIRDQVPLHESPAGHYTAQIDPFYPDHGDAKLTTNVLATCGGAPVEFNLYIDPAGVVTDQWGRPLNGATVTLSHSDAVDGTFTDVPSNDPLLDPDTPTNPETTGSDGMFQWFVATGYYKVKAQKAGCDPYQTGAMQVDPPRTSLVLKLTCSTTAPAPSAAPAVTGTPKVGQTITATAGTWADPLVTDVELLRNDTPLPEDSYQLTASDIGATFTSRVTAKRPDAQSDEGPGADDVNVVVSFTPVTVTSAAVTGQVSDACVAAKAAYNKASAAAQSAQVKAAAAAKKVVKLKKQLKAAKKKHSTKVKKLAAKLKKAKKAAAAADAAAAKAAAAKVAAAAQVTKSC
ncbi:MAG TPA: carboxypeptidase regulatory-like domain-containing protein [Nocardioides sp.]|nr:carboxypeptidase regulatory-like domain-containing protein [Nocardioides sp.]